MSSRIPRAFLPRRALYAAVGEALLIIGSDLYLISRGAFVRAVMFTANGSINPAKVAAIYDELMEEAGISPIDEKSPK